MVRLLLKKFQLRAIEGASFLRSLVRCKSKSKVCVILLTKSPQNYANLCRCIEAYKNNYNLVDFCIVESGKYNPELEQYIYVKPTIPFHYNKYVKIAIDTIPLHAYAGVVISNDDVIALPCALDRLLASGFSSCSPVDPSSKVTSRLWKPTIGYSIEYHLCGWCLFVSTELLVTIGVDILFHDNYHFYLQDVYYAELIERLNVCHAVIPSSKVVHLGHATANIATKEILEYEHLVESLTSDVDESVKCVNAVQRF
jgi:hypothetical protein